MAKIDVNTIEGYADMSADEKVKALEAYTLPDPDYTGYVTKETFDKTASELAAKKRELRDRMTADEAAKLQEKEDMERMQTELAQLRKAATISAHKAKLLGLGYDDALAEDTAQALVDGDTEKVFANQATFIQAQKSAAIAEQMRRTPLPVPGAESGDVNFQKAIDDARNNNDPLAVAYYTRLAAMQEAKR